MFKKPEPKRKKRNPSDLTGRNNAARKKELQSLKRSVQDLSARMSVLEDLVRDLINDKIDAEA